MYETLQSTLSRILLKIQWSTLKKWGSPFVIFSPFWWLASVHCRRRCNGWWHESVGYLYGIPNGIALMALVVTFPALFCRKLLLSLVDFFINQVPVERHTRFIAIPPPLPWLLFWHKVVICTRQNTYFAERYTSAIIELQQKIQIRDLFQKCATMQMKYQTEKSAVIIGGTVATNEALNTLMNLTYRIIN